MNETDDKKFQLYFDDVLVANITQHGSDFPGVFGDYVLAFSDPVDSLRQHIVKYIEFNTEADRLMMSGDESGWEKYIEDNEEPFVDLIETERWSLHDGVEINKILVPIFGLESSVTWRWNFNE
ncbi:MAG: hypothetical protein ABJA67_01405 [Chthonomonadales bacterium]